MVEIAYRLIWSRPAQKELKTIALYYKKEVSLRVAQSIIELFKQKQDGLYTCLS